MHVCAHTVNLCECAPASWPRLSVRAPGEERGGVSSEREAVMGDWSGGDGGSRFHWGFFYGGLAFNITAAEGHPCTLFKIQHRRMKHWTNWDEKAKQALVLKVSTNNITSEAQKFMKLFTFFIPVVLKCFELHM